MLKNLLIMLKMLLFVFHLPRKNTFLIAELNTCHGELLPSWIKFLKDSGKQFEIIVNKEVYNELQPFDKCFENVRIFPFFFRFYKFLFSPLILKRYQKVIFNSEYIYPAADSICNLLEQFNEDRKKFLLVTHNMKMPLSCPAERIGLWKRDIENFTPIYFQYFGEIDLHPISTELKHFVIVGGDNPECRTIQLLYPVLSAMPQHFRSQIKITVIGQNKPQIPEALSDIFDLRGRCSYQELFQTILSCHAILMLLDPENNDHLRYCSGVVSGNINLSYGFHCPVIIESKFARCYDISNENGFVYEGNDKLFDAIMRAMTISPGEHYAVRKALNTMANEKYAESLNSLQHLFSDR